MVAKDGPPSKVPRPVAVATSNMEKSTAATEAHAQAVAGHGHSEESILDISALTDGKNEGLGVTSKLKGG